MLWTKLHTAWDRIFILDSLRSSYPTMDLEPFPKGKATGIPACPVFVFVLETDLTGNTQGKKKKASFN